MQPLNLSNTIIRNNENVKANHAFQAIVFKILNLIILQVPDDKMIGVSLNVALKAKI